MFIDTHAHLVGLKNTDEVVANAVASGVDTIICATAHPDDWAPALDLCQKYNNIFCTLGIHPEYAGTVKIPDTVTDTVIGIGEIGLDYHYDTENKNIQIALFEKQLNIARNAGLPVAIHSRDAESDTAEILHNISGVMHCFTGSWDFAKIMLDRGFYFSASGILTFKNADTLRETFAKIPTDRIVVETDCPWCAPVPHRGEQCTPAMVADTARVLAEIKNLQLDELAVILRENTKQLYPKLCVI